MIKVRVAERDAGQRLDKYLRKYLAKAPSSFVYKMLRKKNITLNEKKASGNEMLRAEDEIAMFLSDDTILKFGGEKNIMARDRKAEDSSSIKKPMKLMENLGLFMKMIMC